MQVFLQKAPALIRGMLNSRIFVGFSEDFVNKQ